MSTNPSLKFPALLLLLLPVISYAQTIPPQVRHSTSIGSGQIYPYSGFVLYDLDKDGYNEMVFVRGGLYKLYYLKGIENGFTGGPVLLDAYLTNGVSDNDATHQSGIALYDADDDGEEEIVFLGYNTPNMYKLDYNDVTGLYDKNLMISSANLTGSRLQLYPANINGDNRPDLVLLGTYSSGGAYWYEQNGDGSYTQHIIQATSFSSPTGKVVDLDGDTHQDLVVLSSNGNMYVFTNNGSGSFTMTTPITTLASGRNYNPTYSNFLVADVNNDTHKDLVVASYDGCWVSIYTNNNDGSFSETVLRAASANYGGVLLGVADVDEDTDLDITAGIPFAPAGVGIFPNNNNSSFDPEETLIKNNSSSLINAGLADDLDGDGIPDYVTNYNSYMYAAKSAFPRYTGTTAATIYQMTITGDGSPTVTLELTNPFSANLRYNNNNAALTNVTVSNNNTDHVTISGTVENILAGLGSIAYTGAFRGDQYMTATVTSSAGVHSVNVPVSITSMSLISLPMEFNELTALPQNGEVMVKWSSATEDNVWYYEVEHATEGTGFSSIGRVTASGNSTVEVKYSLLHSAPTAGKNYYRILAVDKDKQYSYSKVVAATLAQNKTALQLYPNPAVDYSILLLPDEDGRTLTLQSIDGKSIRRIIINPGTSRQVLNTADLKPGVYILTGKPGESVRFVKNR